VARYRRRDPHFLLASVTMFSFVLRHCIPQMALLASDLLNHRCLSKILVRYDTRTYILSAVEECREILAGRRIHFLP